MHLVIAKVDQTLFSGDAQSLTVPAAGGEMTVLGEHMPLVTNLTRGTIVVREQNGNMQQFPIEGGVLEVRSDGATVVL